MRQLARKTSCEFGTFFETDYEKDIDWQAVKRRIMAAADHQNVSMRDVDALVGLDANDPDYYEKYHKLPKLKTAVIVSAFLGVPASWVLSGKGDPHGGDWRRDSNQHVTEARGSAVINGGNAGIVTIYKNSSLEGEHQKELLRVYNSLSLRRQIALLQFAYSLEDGGQPSFKEERNCVSNNV